MLAGVSTEWYTKLEKGHIAGVSEEVLAAVAEALHLDDDERTYLLGLARTAKPARRQPTRRREVPVPAKVQWMLDSITFSAAFIRNGRLDVIGVNALGRALHAAMFDSPTARGGRANFARYHFLDPGSREFFRRLGGRCRRDGRPGAGRGGACAVRHGAAGADRRALHGQRAVQRVLELPRHPHPP